MDYGRGIRFPLQDPQWLSKVAIGTLITFVPILNLAATGYSLDVLNNVYRDRDTPLPEWNNLGHYFGRGFFAAVIQFLWTLPLLIVACPLYAIAFGAAANTSNGDEISATGGLALTCVGLLVFVGALVLFPLTMVATARYATTNQFSEAMPGPVLGELRGHLRPWLITLLVIIGFSMLLGVVGACTFGIGSLLIIPLAFYMQLVSVHWYGQAHRESTSGYTSAPAMV